MSTLLVNEREYAGLRVSLRFDTDTDTLYLVTLDLGTDEECSLNVAPENARDAFEHPGAYGAVRCKCAMCSPPTFEDDEDEYLPDQHGALTARDTDEDEEIPF